MPKLKPGEIVDAVLFGMEQGAHRYHEWSGERVYSGIERIVLQCHVAADLYRRGTGHTLITFEAKKGELRKNTKRHERAIELSTDDLQSGGVDLAIWNRRTENIYGLIELSCDWSVEKCLRHDLAKLARLLAARGIDRPGGTLRTVAVGAYFESHFKFCRSYKYMEEACRRIEIDVMKWWEKSSEEWKVRLEDVGVVPHSMFRGPIGIPDDNNETGGWGCGVCIELSARKPRPTAMGSP